MGAYSETRTAWIIRCDVCGLHTEERHSEAAANHAALEKGWTYDEAKNQWTCPDQWGHHRDYAKAAAVQEDERARLGEFLKEKGLIP